uniref:Tctex1 domain-containing protein 1-B-like n=1 Tax=Saccoglossus kowalevskii TaxID=10224 RepID=A0ABM0MEW3_SACKO|nr:PREDICTED: tctex1 domain-containing protein 1-B-like [Saccoglossus kowalevskii]
MDKPLQQDDKQQPPVTRSKSASATKTFTKTKDVPVVKVISSNVRLITAPKKQNSIASGSSESLQSSGSTPVRLPRVVKSHAPLTRKQSSLSIEGSSDSESAVVGSQRLSQKGSSWIRTIGRRKPGSAMRTSTTRLKPSLICYENTFKTEPDEEIVFDSCKVRKVLEETLAHYLHDKTYDASGSKVMSTKISELIKHRVKDMGYNRYKIVVNVFIGELKGQAFQLVSRSIWNSNTDSFSSASYRNKNLFSVALVYGVYFE